MIKNSELKIEVEKYQKQGDWSKELHFMMDELIKVVEARHNFTEDEDEYYQSGYLMLMGAAKMVDCQRDLFVYFYTCLVNMGRGSFVRQKKYKEILKEIHRDNQ